jgi:hypothetical protein
MRQRVSYPKNIGGFVTEADAALAKYLARRDGCTVSELIRKWLREEAAKPLVGHGEVKGHDQS